MDAVIFARAGSLGVPGKHTRPLGGIPLIFHTIRSLMRCNYVSDVHVVTNDPQTRMAVEEEFLAVHIHDRPGWTATPECTTEDALEWFLGTVDLTPEIILAQATSPFTTGKDWELLVKTFFEPLVDSAAFKTPFHHFILGIDSFCSARMPRQEMSRWREAGNGWVLSPERFKTFKCRTYGAIGWQEIPPVRAIEIDSEDDFTIAEAICNRNLHKRRLK